MSPARRVRAALLRLAPPWRRRHPVQVARADWQTLRITTDSGNPNVSVTTRLYYRAERDPTDEAGA